MSILPAAIWLVLGCSIAKSRTAAGRTWRGGLIGIFAALAAAQVSASPWVEVGDATLRSDIEVLASYRLVPGLLTTWPLPWAQFSALGAVDADRLSIGFEH